MVKLLLIIILFLISYRCCRFFIKKVLYYKAVTQLLQPKK